MDAAFQYDVFLNHSSKDKSVVRPLAERLRKDGLKVWFDEWELKPGDSIPAKIEEGFLLHATRRLLTTGWHLAILQVARDRRLRDAKQMPRRRRTQP